MKNKFISFILVFSFLLTAKLFFAPLYEPFDIKLTELMFKVHTPENASNMITIIDIDAETIDTLGQWPFSRLKLSQVLQNLNKYGAGIIGIDIVFSEVDRSSPHIMAKALNLQGEYLNSDEVLAQTISTTPTILGYYYDFKTDDAKTPKKSPAHFNQINLSNNDTLSIATGAQTNIDAIQSVSYSSGFFNILGLQSGLVDKAALLLKYKENIYPSLAFEMIRIASQSEKVDLFYNSRGLEGIRLNTGDIRTDAQAAININYRGPKHSYTYLSFLDVYNDTFNPQDIEGKFILIGTSDLGLHDIVPTVFDASLPGVEVHATLIDNLLNNDYLYTPSDAIILELILIILFTLILGFIYTKVSARVMIFIAFLSFSGTLYLDYYLMFQRQEVYSFFLPLLAILLTTILFSLQAYANEQKQKAFIKQSFSKKVSQAVVDELLHQDTNTLKNQKKEVSIFFSDIRSFTTLSERMDNPQKLIELLNAYLEPMTENIVHCEGTIDKFIGDAIMAYWNAPLALKNHADIAVNSALEQLRLLNDLNIELKKKFSEEIKIGIGINTDEVIVAEIGSLGRSDYTIIGDAVNLASRCESLCKFYGVSLIITQYTKAKLTQKFFFRELDTVQVLGKEKPIILYEVLEKEDILKLNAYHLALKEYKKGEFSMALEKFLLLEENSSAMIYKIYIQRCEDFIKTPPQNFNGIYKAKEK